MDEVRLRTTACMYAQKYSTKEILHDVHVKNKEFKKNLVSVYTLKQHMSKIKKRGTRPYVIHDISTSGWSS